MIKINKVTADSILTYNISNSNAILFSNQNSSRHYGSYSESELLPYGYNSYRRDRLIVDIIWKETLFWTEMQKLNILYEEG